MRELSNPYRHWIQDNVFPESLIQAALVEWPRADWPHWHSYDAETSRKMATKDIDRLPVACRMLFDELCRLDLCDTTGLDLLFPDLSAYGAGLHWIPPGGHLSCHLDSERHPTTKWRRRLSCCLYLSDWSPGDGGELLMRATPTAKPRKIEPRRNRLLVFECGENAYHEVAQVHQPGGRKSIATFFWTEDDTQCDQKRKHATFTAST